MSHPIPGHDYENEYPDDAYKPVSAKHKALHKKAGKKFKSPVSKLLNDLKPRHGESSLSRLKRLTGHTG